MIILMFKLLILALFILYSVIEGIREGLYYDLKYKTTKGDLGEHTLFTVQRCVFVLFMFSLSFLINSNPIYTLIETFFIILMFPYFHDGAYYMTRNNANSDIYKKRWRDNSITSTAKFEIKYPLRISLFIGGVVCYTLLLIIQLK